MRIYFKGIYTIHKPDKSICTSTNLHAQVMLFIRYVLCWDPILSNIGEWRIDQCIALISFKPVLGEIKP